MVSIPDPMLVTRALDPVFILKKGRFGKLAESYETLSQLLASGEKLSFTQSFFVKFYQAFLYNDRWMLYLNGVATTLLVTAFALIFGILLGTFVALVRTAHDQQRSKKNILLGLLNLIFKIYVTIIRGTPMMVQLLIMGMVVFSSSPWSQLYDDDAVYHHPAGNQVGTSRPGQ